MNVFGNISRGFRFAGCGVTVPRHFLYAKQATITGLESRAKDVIIYTTLATSWELFQNSEREESQIFTL